jgi:hypothetical protein
MTSRTLGFVVAFCCTIVLRAEDNPYEKVSESMRMDAIRRAEVWMPVNVSARNLKEGPRTKGAVRAGQTVTCQYFDKDSGGKTPKFWCALAPADEVKVKYGEDNGEVYAEVAATRLLWALGFGADGMYPATVVCQGCSPDPFGDRQTKKTAPTNASQIFDPAVIERAAPGDIMESGKHSGWGWVDLNSVDQTRGGAPLAHRDALKLLAVLMQHTDTKPEQQRLVCLDRVKGLPAKDNGSCAHPFMMLGDLGKTFGKANLFNKDEPGSANLKAWSEAGIWRGDEGCVGDMDQSFTGTLDRPKISEDGRRHLSDLLEKLSDDQIRDLFEVAQFTRRDTTTTVDDWVRVFKQKRAEIAGRRCTNPAI